MAVKRTAGKSWSETEVKVRKRCSETRYEGKQSEDCHGFHASALLVLQISLQRSAMHRFLQTYSKRYDFFDRFRSFSSTAIDRGIGIDRFGVEKTTFDFCTEMYGAPAKNCSGPENRDASILLRRLLGYVLTFSTVFDRFRAPRLIEASASVESALKKQRSRFH